ncbi:MAG: glutaminyl-peptide cyclotransferase [Cyclobacteriaceae bacterium]
MRFFRKISLVIALLTFFSCSENGDSEKAENSEPTQREVENYSLIVGVTNNQRLTIGEALTITARGLIDTVSVKSLTATIGGQEFTDPSELNIPTDALAVGNQSIEVNVDLGFKTESKQFNLEMLSDIAPAKYTYERVQWFIHDPDAYTQGLFYHDGFLYENTGQRGRSSLRKVELETGAVVQQAFLQDQFFGEGITLWDDKIIQLTWTSNQGFVYDLGTFEEVKTFNYPTEGWGITSLENELVMTDGTTSNLYFLDSETLAETRRLSVYDDKGPQDQLNELEYIDGLIYANVYQTDFIITIDPQTGKITSEIDLKGLLNAQTNRPVDVLNGIAYDTENDRLFVTGKLWPRLYEIRLVEKVSG